jgi:hypothetical protein
MEGWSPSRRWRPGIPSGEPRARLARTLSHYAAIPSIGRPHAVCPVPEPRIPTSGQLRVAAPTSRPAAPCYHASCGARQKTRIRGRCNGNTESGNTPSVDFLRERRTSPDGGTLVGARPKDLLSAARGPDSKHETSPRALPARSFSRRSTFQIRPGAARRLLQEVNESISGFGISWLRSADPAPPGPQDSQRRASDGGERRLGRVDGGIGACEKISMASCRASPLRQPHAPASPDATCRHPIAHPPASAPPAIPPVLRPWTGSVRNGEPVCWATDWGG